jgi:hypothetical protein
MCGKDVHDNANYVSNDLDEATCSRCAQERWLPRGPGNDPAWVPDYKPGACSRNQRLREPSTLGQDEFLFSGSNNLAFSP